MTRERTFVQLPQELAKDIDTLVGSRNRSSFTTEAVRRELKRLQQQLALRAAGGIWKDADHPELADGAAAYIDKIRTAEAELEDARLNKLSSAQSA